MALKEQMWLEEYFPILTLFFIISKIIKNSALAWCGSVNGALACEPKSRQFNSQSGHMPGMQARSPVGDAQEATTH